MINLFYDNAALLESSPRRFIKREWCYWYFLILPCWVLCARTSKFPGLLIFWYIFRSSWSQFYRTSTWQAGFWEIIAVHSVGSQAETNDNGLLVCLYYVVYLEQYLLFWSIITFFCEGRQCWFLCSIRYFLMLPQWCIVEFLFFYISLIHLHPSISHLNDCSCVG